ncbi:putative ABC multidrug transporter [Aspergillus fijiensis CBS 313.89]|uniref:Putative ABC multidrug transporter n=1 Tax=Aspergillus fijiensis CBS 313.89 TaxID=1448319 RepID=A0A8G1RXV7_9EURO|nr:putative ABC multidrug transporter [Aspergillus fijiensis CBS 313.89]RAK81560.1 putative ABC multidrug transporter [Aspergillus fijiensis CBS 313.89]
MANKLPGGPNEGSITQPEEITLHNLDSGGWELGPLVQTFHQNMREEGYPERRLGVTWRNLTVKGISSGAAMNENVLSQFDVVRQARQVRQKPALKTIVSDSHGCVKPGEMLLVLGRPGAGCTTLLKMLANHREGYAQVEGDVHYGSMTSDEAHPYRGQIAMNTEDELFYPSLTVNKTMDFATRLKVPGHIPANAKNGQSQTAEEYRQERKEFLLESMGIAHTQNTKVGNEYVRGVSGGERKRVSIIECLATNASVYCWDNSTRGLDASSALDWARALRYMTTELGLATIVTLYQAGNGIYDLFDKVLVLDEGKQIFYGPRVEARPFMENLGFVCRPGANIGDYLTGLTVPTERLIDPSFRTFPETADAILQIYEGSVIRKNMEKEYAYPSSPEAQANTEAFCASVAFEKQKGVKATDPMTVTFPQQVWTCVQRQYQITFGDMASFAIKQMSTLVQALIAGSLFYNAAADSSGLFIRGGALFFSLLYNALMGMSEVVDSFTGRPVLIKHKSFAYFHPAAFCIAQIAADIPMVLIQITVFGIIIYFMVGLTSSAAAFFTYWIMLFATTMCITAMFRAVGAAFRTFDGASKVSGFLISALVMYTGYMIQKPDMHPWFVWIYWIDPLAYAFESVLSNEFHDKVIDCVGGNIIPAGPGYSATPGQASCAGVGGAVHGEVSLTGDQYLHSLSYSHSHVWRNFGIVWCWWALFVGITVLATMRWRDRGATGATRLVPYELARKGRVVVDEESQAPPDDRRSDKSSAAISPTPNAATIARNTSIFTWKNLKYTVKTPQGDRVLLNDIYGWVKPGMLGALMGSSGAGKTTLLDVLAQRKTDGTIQGSILVDGRPLDVSFQRSAGYCEQLDVHEAMTTVREALEFSALLRQPAHIPREEKLAYVDAIIDLLELHDIADILIGKPGAGLSIEQRKRVTIGVELVSKPKILIFLDEPTSGLDGQSAFNTVRFLRGLADLGQAILVTIHQPSAQLFTQFDTLLLLAKGGKMVYFGDIGENAQTMKDYFARNGVTCPPESNPAEFMIDVVTGRLSKRDWHEVWMESPEHTQRLSELDQMVKEAEQRPVGEPDLSEFALSLWEQTKIVTRRMNLALYRNTDYINNKVALHIASALFNGFTFWMIGDSVSDMQLRLFTVFNFVFVAAGVINQLQPLFIERRDIYDTREKKSRMYSWKAFVTALIVSEFPYLCVCGVLYYVCWYYTVRFSSDSNKAGATFFVMLMYEFLYTGIGQFIAAYAPNALFASLANPLVIGILVSFCGVMVPYAEINVFWRYWMYYLNPFNYLMGSMLVFTVWDTDVRCTQSELAIFDPPSNSTCGQYLSTYLETLGSAADLLNPGATAQCEVCPYSRGSDYLATLNLPHYYDGWRNTAIVVIFVFSSYGLVFLMMKLRTKASKKAE